MEVQVRQNSVLPLALSYARGSGHPKAQFAVWLMLAIAPRPAMGTKAGSSLFENAEYDDTDVFPATTSSNYVLEEAC